ncbi:MAG: PH domain-containing protein [Planctomycetaceae bacterium]
MPSTSPKLVAATRQSVENTLMTVYPSISAWWSGKLLGQLYDLIPVRLGTITLSRFLFTLPTAPIAVVLYALTKLMGSRYRLTNRNLQEWSSLGNRMKRQMDLGEIADVVVEQVSGQAFFSAADLVIHSTDGKTGMRLAAVPRAEVFRQTILKASHARTLVQSALETIQAR